jgi:hypothetical protein
MIRRPIVTDNDAAVTFLRLVLGVVFFFLMIRGAGAASVDRLLSSPAKKSIPAKVRPQAA